MDRKEKKEKKKQEREKGNLVWSYTIVNQREIFSYIILCYIILCCIILLLLYLLDSLLVFQQHLSPQTRRTNLLSFHLKQNFCKQQFDIAAQQIHESIPSFVQLHKDACSFHT